MHNFLILFSLISFILSTTHLVPEEYSSIQAGIDAAIDGDTVLVNQGIYYENIHLTKSVVLSSYAIFDDLANWTTYNDFSEQWQVANDNIDNTIIDGSAATDDYGSCILIYSVEEQCISPEVIGFTIRNGIGTEVRRNPGSDEESQQRIGGGILFDISNPTISFNQIKNNGSADVFSGGGTYGTSMEEDWSFNNRDLNIRSRCNIEEFNLQNNLYKGNDALYGNTFANEDFEDTINMSGSIFDVASCEQEQISSAWVYAKSVSEIELENISSNLCAISGNSAYVNPNIENECISQGCGENSNNPFKTIERALQMIMPSESNQTTIYLTNGSYSPDMGEIFPIIVPDYVTIYGENSELTVIDAMHESTVFPIINSINVKLNNLTIKNGLKSESLYSSGIHCENSDVYFDNLILESNGLEDVPWYELGLGGGLFLKETNNSIITNLIVRDNIAGYGGGIYIFKSNSTFKNLLVHDNIANNGHGGGIMIDRCSPTLINATISNNSSDSWTGEQSGGIGLSFDASPMIINSIIINNNGEIWSDCDYTNSLSISFSNIGEYIDEIDCLNILYNNSNIDMDPLFNDNYSLQENSPCIDSGNPNLWYSDSDGSIADMGYTSTSGVLPNFVSYNFGEVGDIPIQTTFKLYNYGNDIIEVDSVNLSSNSFYSNSNFPMVVEPENSININIICDPQILGNINDNMIIYSSDLIDGLYVDLYAEGSIGNLLNGSLEGILEADIYRITGDLIIEDNASLIISPGSQLLFDYNTKFTINGQLIAQGTQSDSIIFDRSPYYPSWLGIYMNNQSNSTILDHVRISNGEKLAGGAIYMVNSSPLILNSKIVNNRSTVVIEGVEWNQAFHNCYENGGGALYLSGSYPIFKNVLLTNNYISQHASEDVRTCANLMYSYLSHPIFINVTAANNFPENPPYHKQFNGAFSSVTIINSIMKGQNDDYYQFKLATDTESNNGWGVFNPNVYNSNIGDTSVYNYAFNSFNIDPLFFDSENGDYSLMENSPCIDAGISFFDNNGEIILDLDQNEYSGLAPDMGAYEFEQNSGSTTGDLNFDGIVNVIDIITVVNLILDSSPYNAAADLNNDTIINVIDIIAIINIILNL